MRSSETHPRRASTPKGVVFAGNPCRPQSFRLDPHMTALPNLGKNRALPTTTTIVSTPNGHGPMMKDALFGNARPHHWQQSPSNPNFRPETNAFPVLPPSRSLGTEPSHCKPAKPSHISAHIQWEPCRWE